MKIRFVGYYQRFDESEITNGDTLYGNYLYYPLKKLIDILNTDSDKSYRSIFMRVVGKPASVKHTQDYRFGAVISITIVLDHRNAK